MQCKNCGMYNEDNAVFCASCGQQLDAPLGQGVVKKDNGTDYSIASLVLGIISILSCSGSIVGLACGILAVVFAKKERRKQNENSYVKGGFICGVVGIILSSLYTLFLIVYIAAFIKLAIYTGAGTI